MSQVILKSGHVQPVWAGHPWVFPQGIDKTKGSPAHGDEVAVMDAKGNVLGRGTYAKGSSIAVRIYTRGSEALDRELFITRLRAAVRLRETLALPLSPSTTGYRAFHGEGDGLPGLIVDRFDDVLVMQLGTAGLGRRREELLDALQLVFAPRAIIERTTDRAAQSEGFEAKRGVVRGQQVSHLVMSELGLRYEIPVELSQKTGYYFDQRPLRHRVEQLSPGRSVLDTYCFVGSIGLLAKRAGAGQVVCVDSSASALELGANFARANDLDVSFERAKALDYLGAAGPMFDIVIADPPKLAQSRAGLKKAMHAFRGICAATVARTTPSGIAIVSSCSAALGIDQVERCLALGARDVGRNVVVFERISQGGDHPVPPAFPEGRYLSTALAYVY